MWGAVIRSYVTATDFTDRKDEVLKSVLRCPAKNDVTIAAELLGYGVNLYIPPYAAGSPVAAGVSGFGYGGILNRIKSASAVPLYADANVFHLQVSRTEAFKTMADGRFRLDVNRHGGTFNTVYCDGRATVKHEKSVYSQTDWNEFMVYGGFPERRP